MLLARVLFIKLSCRLRKLLHFLEGSTTLEKKKTRKEFSGRKRKFEETVRALQVLSTSDVPGKAFLSARFTDRWFSVQFKNVVTSP